MSAKLVKELRDRTGAGFLDCKKAIEASNGDVEKAIEWLQERGSAKAAKKAGAIASEGITGAISDENNAVIFELNSQTDFVAQNKEFQELAILIKEALLKNDFSNINEANAIEVNGKKLSEICIEATAKIGEKIELRRAVRLSRKGLSVGVYNHVNQRISAILLTEGGNDEIARNVAMHIASMNPQYLDEVSVPTDIVAKIKEEINASPTLEGKPENIKENIVEGMLRKQLSELTLVDQEFVMEKMPVSKYLGNNKAKAVKMVRLEVGEGIEVEKTDFAAEVAAQMKN